MTLRGSYQNRLMESMRNTPTPEPGMGATELMYSDRNPYTVVAVLSPREIVVQADDYQRVEGSGFGEAAEFTFSRNESATRETVVLRVTKSFPAGKWTRKGDSIKGAGFLIGQRMRYRDPSF